MTPARRDDAPAGIRLGSLRGVPVYLGWSWLLFAAIVVWIVGDAHDGPTGIVVGVLYALSLLLSVLVHEAAHALAAQRAGMHVLRVVADLWGGHTAYDGRSSTPGRAAAIAVVGPLANLALSAVAFAVSPLVPAGAASFVVGGIAFLNLLLAGFNLLPGLPLDGGQLVQSLVWGITGDRNRGLVVAGWTGRLVTIGVLLAWIGLPLATGRDVDTGSLIWVAMIGLFMWQGASAAIQQGTVVGRVERATLGSTMLPATAISSEASVADALATPGLPVVLEGLGRPYGIVDLTAAGQVPEAVRASTSVMAVVNPQPPNWVVTADPAGGLDQVLPALQSGPSPLAVVHAGRVVGVIGIGEVNRVLARR